MGMGVLVQKKLFSITLIEFALFIFHLSPHFFESIQKALINHLKNYIAIVQKNDQKKKVFLMPHNI